MQDLGVKKIVPNKQDLVAAYQLFKRGVSIREMVSQAIAYAEPVPVPKDLERQVRAYLEEHPEAPWDTAVAKLTGWTRDDS